MLETIFADTLDPSRSERMRRGWTTLTSFGLQAVVAVFLMILPLLRSSNLPTFHQLSTPVSLGEPIAETPAVSAHTSPNRASTKPPEFIFTKPSSLPINLHPSDDEGPPQIANSGPYLPGPAVGDPHGVPNLFSSTPRSILPVAPAPPATVRPIRLSHMSEGNLIHKVQPAYPALARAARIQGAVVLQAVISKQGTIENLVVLSGHPMLAPAALDAVRQWRYRPYILNAEPVEVETQITVNFSLGGS
jgi:periplasmic protein TonB